MDHNSIILHATALFTATVWRSTCPSSTSCCEAWQAKVNASMALLRLQFREQGRWLTQSRNNASRLWGRNSISMYDLFESTWSCESRERMPHQIQVGWGDGPKWVCGVAALDALDSCLIYSFGSNAETSFEKAMKQRAPRCEIHTFDPTLSAAQYAEMRKVEQQGALRFTPVGISDRDAPFRINNRTFAAKTLASIRGSLGHSNRSLDLLKVDVEGAEYRVFDSLKGQEFAQIKQLQVEMHPSNFSMIVKLVNKIQSAGLQIFNKEINHWVSHYSGRFVEMSFVGPDHAFRAFQLTHPSCNAEEERRVPRQWV